MADNESLDIQKAESHKRIKTPISSEKGQPRIVTSAKLIQDSKKKELSPDNRLATFDAMLADADVFAAVNYTKLFSIKALYKGKVVGKKGNKVSEEAAKFLNYNLRNLDYGTWYQAVCDMTTAIQYGWSDLNVVVKRRNHGPYKNWKCLSKLAPRDQKSVYGWLWNDDFTEWKGLVQKPPLKKTGRIVPSRLSDGFSALNQGRYYESIYPIIHSEQLIHVAYNSTLNNPQGDSPLMHCYDAWYEKKLIENFEFGGIAKDLNGVLIIKVPSELLERASDPDTYPEAAAELEEYQRDAAEAVQGKATHILITSDVDPTTKTPLYDIELKGVTGAGGKNYITSQVIDQKRKAIFNTFGAGFLLLGQDGTGSYALSSTQTSVHGHLVERDIMMFVDAINNQLLPRLLAANDVYLNYDEMPEFVAGEPDEVSLDELGKFIQRVKSVNAMTPAMLEYLAEKGGIPTDGIEDIDFTDKGASRSGDGMKTPGSGTSTNVGGGDKATSNTEGGGVTKNFHASDTDDRIFDDLGNVVNSEDLDDDGYYK